MQECGPKSNKYIFDELDKKTREKYWKWYILSVKLVQLYIYITYNKELKNFKVINIIQLNNIYY